MFSEKDKINVGTIKHDDEQTEFQNNAFKGNGDNGKELYFNYYTNQIACFNFIYLTMSFVFKN